jgi:hypothetical protein
MFWLSKGCPYQGWVINFAKHGALLTVGKAMGLVNHRRIQ